MLKPRKKNHKKPQVCSGSLVPGELPELGGNQGVVIRQMVSMAMEAEKGGIISVAPLLVDAAELPSKGQGKLRISGLQFF